MVANRKLIMSEDGPQTTLSVSRKIKMGEHQYDIDMNASRVSVSNCCGSVDGTFSDFEQLLNILYNMQSEWPRANAALNNPPTK